MEILKLIEMAAKLGLPGIVVQGVEMIAEVKRAADSAKHVLSEGNRADLEAAHAGALAAADRLDAKLAAAEKVK
jgi:hypothetical protein